MSEVANEAVLDSDQYLTFTLAKEIFALDIGTIREVLELTPITKIPRTPEYMCGVINLRGHAVPVVDMRQKLNMSKGEYTVDTCIIIVEVEYDGEVTVMGALVDSVSEVTEMPPSSIEAAPKMGAIIDTVYIRGMGRINEKFVIILDINRVFSAKELAFVRSLSANDENEEE